MIQEQKLARFKVKFGCIASPWGSWEPCPHGTMPLPSVGAMFCNAEHLTEPSPLLSAAASIGSGWRIRWHRVGFLSLPAVTFSNMGSQSLFEQWLVATRKKVKDLHVSWAWCFRTKYLSCNTLYYSNKYSIGSSIYQHIGIGCINVVPLCKRFFSFRLHNRNLFFHRLLNMEACSVTSP